MQKLNAVEVTSKLPFKRMLLVLKPMEVHPTWERLIAGNEVGNFDFFSLSFAKRILLSKSHVEYVKANPRPADYIMNAALNFFGKTAPDAKLDVLFDSEKTREEITPQLKSVSKVWQASSNNYRSFPPELLEQIRAANYDCLALLYADPIGQSWNRLEQKLATLPAHVLVFNGRRRAFYWDAPARRWLRWRRFLRHFWILETLIVLPLSLLALILAAYDLTIGQLLRKSAK